MITATELKEFKAGEDPEMLDYEKECFIHITKDDPKEIYVTSSIKATTDYLLRNPNFNPKRHFIKGDKIVHLEGTIPISCLRLKDPSRSDDMNYLSRVIS